MLSIATMAAWKTEGLIGKGSFFGIGTQAGERVQREVSDAGGESLDVGFGLRHRRPEAVDEDTPVIEVDAQADDVMREHLALHVRLRLAQNSGDDAMNLFGLAAPTSSQLHHQIYCMSTPVAERGQSHLLLTSRVFGCTLQPEQEEAVLVGRTPQERPVVVAEVVEWQHSDGYRRLH